MCYFLAKFKGTYKYSKSLRNNEVVLWKANFVLPDEIGFSKEELFFVYDLQVLDNLGIKILLKRLYDIITEAYNRNYDRLFMVYSSISKHIYTVSDLETTIEGIIEVEQWRTSLNLSLEEFLQRLQVMELPFSR